MEIGILMGLLSLGLLFGMGGDNDSDEEPVEQPDVEQDVEGELILFDGSETLLGTENNDTLEGGQDQSLAPNVVILGAGDDSAFIDTNSGFGVDVGIGVFGEEGDDTIEFSSAVGTAQATGVGGEGNDTIIGNAFARIYGDGGNDLLVLDDDGEQLEAEAFGGEGNDTITALQDNSVFGEDGDDTINITHANLWNGTGLASGGAGDDMIAISTDLGSPFLVQEGLLVEGNEGRDTFTLDLDIVDDAQWQEVGGSANGTGIVIRDFNPDEDRIVVDVESAQTGQTYEATLMAQSEGVYNLVLTVVEEGLDAGLPPRTIDFTIQTTGPITTDDISFVGGVPLQT